MSISAAQVKELRELTGAGMMDCKAALAETNGDMEAAVDWLRKKGISKADKKAGRTAAEGLIGVDSALREAAVVEVNSETDFVARNEHSRRSCATSPRWRWPIGGKTETVAAAKYPGSDKSVTDTIKDAVGTIGENSSFRRSAKLVGRARRGRDLRPQRRCRRPRQARRAGGARNHRQGRGAPTPSRARSPCMSPPPTRWR